MASIKQFLSQALIQLIRAYRLLIGGFFGPCACRFEPSCSTYAMEAVRIHGCFKGGMLTFWRLLRCHPWHPGGQDDVKN